MQIIQRIHHIAIICTDYQRSKAFYTNALGLSILQEHFRAGRNSWKLDLAIGNDYVIELFSFPDPPKRPSRPEAAGMRHLAFAVENLNIAIAQLTLHNVKTEPVRIDEFTGKRFTFFADPDDLPLELYEI